MSEREHELKCWLEFFGPLLDGSKPFEVRFNDRDYRVGDVLHMREYTPVTNLYTGRDCRLRVTYVLTDRFGVDPSHVVMGVKRLPEKTEDILAQLTAARAELEAKDKEIARLTEQSQTRLRHLEAAAERVARGADEVERQSVLLGKADIALADAIEAERDLKQKAFGTSDCLVHSYCEATLRSLRANIIQLKGK